MRIRQLRVSTAIATFEEDFRARFGLRPYTNPRKPAVFFGCYSCNRPDLSIVLAHKALGVLVWGGSDSMYGVSKFRQLARKKNIKHVAISKWISDDLMKHGISHISIPITPRAPEQFSPEPLGDSVFFYTNHNAGALYGDATFEEVRRKMPHVKFIVAHSKPPGHYTKEQMPGIYSQCFMGLRLTNHDGLSNTVIELGLMGRRCVWNGWSPNAIPWKTSDDVVRAVLAEQKRKGKTFPQLAKDVYDYVDVGNQWLTTEFWGDDA